MAKKKTDKIDLSGINEIADFARKSIATLLDWHRDYCFPMRKLDGIFVSSRAEIRDWYEIRGVNPETVNLGHLDDFRDKEMGKKNYKFINKKLNSLEEIMKISGSSAITVLDWVKYFVDCPIERSKNGNLSVDADALYYWTLNHNFNVRFQLGATSK